ncbi:MAG: membrane dipeptidase [Oscillospiraceae bacterium]|nr:membrane dipeptidase [Oscillospiraceae bacterium]
MDFFDLHCDTITTAMHQSCGLDCGYLDISFPKNEKIRRHAQCFAIFCPDVISGDDAFNYYTMAKHFFNAQHEKFPQFFEQAKAVEDIDRITGDGKTAAILTVEGGRVLGGKIERLQKLFDDGVRMMTLTWNGENEIGKGSTDQNFGLKPFGIDIIKEMESIGMVIDVSHLSDAGLDDVLKNVDCPVVASHSNLREVCSHRRNLTDEYFKEIVRRGGIVGINFYKAFLNNDEEKASLSDILKHIERMLLLGGENSVSMGSDYDGCDVVDGIRKMNDIPNLYDLVKKDFGEELAEKIFWKNAYNFFAGNLR